MILGQVSWLDCIVFLIFLAPQLIIQVGFFRTMSCGLQALPFLRTSPRFPFCFFCALSLWQTGDALRFQLPFPLPVQSPDSPQSSNYPWDSYMITSSSVTNIEIPLCSRHHGLKTLSFDVYDTHLHSFPRALEESSFPNQCLCHS